MPASPSMRRRRLAAELRKLRDQSGLQVTEAARRLGWQASRLSRIENRQSGVTAPDLRKLLDLYEVTDETYRGHLADLARRVNERGWWQKYAGLIGSEYADLIGLEEEARASRSYEQELVPGLLQTPDYARAAIRASRPVDTSRGDRPPGGDPDGAPGDPGSLRPGRSGSTSCSARRCCGGRSAATR